MTGRCAQPQALDRRAHKTKSNAGVFRQTTPAAPRQGFAAGLPGPRLQLRMFAQHALEPIKRDSSAKAVHLMHADVGREPAANSRQLVVRAAVKRCVVQVPGRYLGPKRILDLVQCRRAKRRWMPLVSMVLYPRPQTAAHQSDRRHPVSHEEQISRADAEHDKGLQ